MNKKHGYLDITKPLWTRASETEHNAALDTLNSLGISIIRQEEHPLVPDTLRLFIEGESVQPASPHVLELTRAEDQTVTARLIPIPETPTSMQTLNLPQGSFGTPGWQTAITENPIYACIFPPDWQNDPDTTPVWQRITYAKSLHKIILCLILPGARPPDELFAGYDPARLYYQHATGNPIADGEETNRLLDEICTTHNIPLE